MYAVKTMKTVANREWIQLILFLPGIINRCKRYPAILQDANNWALYGLKSRSELRAEKWKKQADPAVQKLEMKVVHETMMCISKPLVPCESISFEKIALGQENCQVFSITIQDCCDIPQGKGIS